MPEQFFKVDGVGLKCCLLTQGHTSVGRRRLEETPACSVRRKARALVPRPRPLSVLEIRRGPRLPTAPVTRPPARPRLPPRPRRCRPPRGPAAESPWVSSAGLRPIQVARSRASPRDACQDRMPPPRPGSEQTVWRPAAPAGSASASDESRSRAASAASADCAASAAPTTTAVPTGGVGSNARTNAKAATSRMTMLFPGVHRPPEGAAEPPLQERVGPTRSSAPDTPPPQGAYDLHGRRSSRATNRDRRARRSKTERRGNRLPRPRSRCARSRRA